MVSFHMGWLGVLEEVGPVLELVEVDRGTGTWRQGQAVEVDSCLGMSFLNCDDKIVRYGAEAVWNLNSKMPNSRLEQGLREGFG